MVRKRKLETWLYLGIWVLVVALYLLDIMRARSYTALPLLDWSVVGHMFLTLMPFMVLFAVNNLVLVPRWLLQNRYLGYLILTAVLVVAVWGWQNFYFRSEIASHPAMIPPGGHHFPPHLLPLPVFLDFVYDVLVVVVNLTIALLFQRYDDKLVHESLRKTDAESQLVYLKEQINPHFYMNMLNNIHGMIEINPEKAQEMVIDMSCMMRYMLYESSNRMISLSSEIGFLKKYLQVMRYRFPESKVGISAALPDEMACAGVMIPPLLFLVFIENAFKHGISYTGESFVEISIAAAGGQVEFMCLNSVHRSVDTQTGGIGLRNVRQRLRLIYGDRFNLDIRSTQSCYSVTLNIPVHENQDTDS